MTPRQTSIAVGLLAGLAAALLSLGAGTPSSMSFLLLSTAMLPVLIASLGWGDLAAVVGAAAAGAIIAFVLTPLAALMFLATSLGPAAWIGHLFKLSRPAEEVGGPSEALAWYPLSDLMMHLCGLVTLGLIVLGFIVGYGDAVVGEMVDTFIQVVQQQTPSYNPDPDAVSQMKLIFARALPAVQGALWVAILFAALYVAAGIVRMSGLATRPKDDIPASLRMPRPALAAFAAGLFLTFIGGVPALIGSAVCGTFGAGFILAGFAVLHHRTRGRPWRFAALWLAYLAVILFTLPLVFFFLAGLLQTARTIPFARSDPPRGPPGNPADNDP